MSTGDRDPIARRRCPEAVLVLLIAALLSQPVMAHAEVEGVRSERRCEVIIHPPQEDADNGRNPVVIAFMGYVYPSGVWLHRDVQHPHAVRRDELFVSQAIRIQATGNRDEILALWAEAERTAIASMLSNDAVFAANRHFYAGVTASAVRARIHYGNYIVFLVQHIGAFGSIIKNYPIYQEGQHYFLTNSLSEDPVFQYLTTAYKNTLPIMNVP